MMRTRGSPARNARSRYFSSSSVASSTVRPIRLISMRMSSVFALVTETTTLFCFRAAANGVSCFCCGFGSAISSRFTRILMGPSATSKTSFSTSRCTTATLFIALSRTLSPGAIWRSRCGWAPGISDYNQEAMATVTLSTTIQPRSPQGDFRNEPFVDFKTSDNARAMRAALDRVALQLGREYDLVIGAEHVSTSGKIESLNPARPAQIVGIHQKAGLEHAEQAMTAALAAYETWSRTTVEERASLLLNAAETIRPRN